MSSFKVVSFRGCIEINEGESNEDALKRVEEYLGKFIYKAGTGCATCFLGEDEAEVDETEE